MFLFDICFVCLCALVCSCVQRSVKCVPQLLSTLIFKTLPSELTHLASLAGLAGQSTCSRDPPVLFFCSHRGLQKEATVLSSYMEIGDLNFGPDDCLASTLPLGFCLIKAYFINCWV